MILYHAGGVRDIELLKIQFAAEDWSRLRNSVIRLLRSRSANRAAELLDSVPFDVYEATNVFRDKFSALHAVVTLDCYSDLIDSKADLESQLAFRRIAETITEIGHYIRFITVVLNTEIGTELVASPSPQITSEILERALADAEQLIHSQGASSGVDRVHTAFHAYLRAVCSSSGIICT